MFLEGWRGEERRGGCGSLAKAQATARVDVPTTPLSLSLQSIVVAGERSVLVSGDDEDEGEAHPHVSHLCISEARARGNGDKRVT